MGVGFGIGAITCIDALTLHRRGHLDRIDDLLVAGATAEIAIDRRLDLVTGGIDIGLEEGGADDEESRRAEAALAAAGLGKALLNRMQMMAIRQTLDRGDRRAFSLAGKAETRQARLPINLDRAAATCPHVAASLEPQRPDLIAQNIEQNRVALDEVLGLYAVHNRLPRRTVGTGKHRDPDVNAHDDQSHPIRPAL